MLIVVACNGGAHSLGRPRDAQLAGGAGGDDGGTTGIGGALGGGASGAAANGGLAGNAGDTAGMGGESSGTGGESSGTGGESSGMGGESAGTSGSSGSGGVCEPGERQCSLGWVRTCDEDGEWAMAAACPLQQTCVSGACGGGKLLAADGASEDEFGVSLSMSGDTVAVGAFSDADNGDYSGSAYVFTRTGSSFSQKKLLPSDGAANDWFGTSISVDGGTVVVGAPDDDDDAGAENTGSVYVFVRTGSSFVQQQKLLADDGTEHDRFGVSVSLSGDTLVVGANDDDHGRYFGSAYVFVRTGSSFVQQQKLFANDGIPSQFGSSVSVSGDTLVIGAVEDYERGSQAGAAYVFVRNGSSFEERQKLLPDDGGVYGGAYDRFGCSVSVDGDTMIVGAYSDGEDNEIGTGPGSAYIFVRNGASFVKQQKLFPEDGKAYEAFGASVSVSGDNVMVGAPYDDDNGSGSGSAYVFSRTGSTWTRQKLLPGDGAAEFLFGAPVSLSGATAVVSSIWDDDNGLYSGSVYVFALPAPLERGY